MSLEDKIQGLTDAVRALTASLKPTTLIRVAEDPQPWAGEFLPADIPALAKAEVAPPKPERSEKSSTTLPTASSTAPTLPESSTNPATLTIDYAQVAKAITDTFKVDRAKTINALAKFGAAKGPQLKPEDYAAFLKELTA